MMLAQQQCLKILQGRFHNVHFRVGMPPFVKCSNSFVIDKQILEQMALDPKAAREYENGIALLVELQRALRKKGVSNSSFVMLH